MQPNFPISFWSLVASGAALPSHQFSHFLFIQYTHFCAFFHSASPIWYPLLAPFNKIPDCLFFLRDVAINKNIQLYIQIHLHAYLCGGTGIEMTPQTNSLTLVIQTHIVTSWLHSFSPSYISSHNFPSNIFILLLFLQDATCTQLVTYPRKISRLHIVSFFKLIALHICVWWAIPSSSESMCSLCGHSLPQLLI